MVRDADRKLQQEVDRRLSMDRPRHGEEFNGAPDSFLMDTTGGTLTRRAPARQDEAKRRSMPYRESDDEEEDPSRAERGRFGNKLNSLFK